MLYKLIHYQFGSFVGRSFADEGSNFSASLSYYFDGIAFLPSCFLNMSARQCISGVVWIQRVLSGAWAPTDELELALQVRDLWNLLDMGNSAHRSICAEVGEFTNLSVRVAALPVAMTIEGLETSIKSTVVANAVYKPLDVYVQYYWYDVYRNLSIEKRYPFGSGKVGVVGTSKRQLGAAFYWQGLSASYIVDDLNIKQVRDARIGCRINIGGDCSSLICRW